MKDINESPETIEAYATIDAGHIILAELFEENSKMMTVVDKNKSIETDKVLIHILKGIFVVKEVIKAKIFIEDDFLPEQQLLDDFQNTLDDLKKQAGVIA